MQIYPKDRAQSTPVKIEKQIEYSRLARNNSCAAGKIRLRICRTCDAECAIQYHEYYCVHFICPFCYFSLFHSFCLIILFTTAKRVLARCCVCCYCCRCCCCSRCCYTFCCSQTWLDIQVPVGTPDRALRTVPEGIFEVRRSLIPRAGMGAFASTFIPRHTWLGAYEGELIPKGDRESSGYTWVVWCNI